MSPLQNGPDIDGHGSQAAEEIHNKNRVKEKNIINQSDINENDRQTNQIKKIPNTNQKKRTERKRLQRQKQRAAKQARANDEEVETENTTQYSNEEVTWGDELIINSERNSITDQSTFRLVHYNVNGITHAHEYIEWETIMQSMSDIQADVYTLNETKIDTRNSSVQFEIRQKSKLNDPRILIKMESLCQSPRTRQSVYKPGGTMICTSGQWAGRAINNKNDQSKDPLGRWSVQHLKGRGNTVISIFSVYRVCPADKGENTAYVQQQNDLYKKHGRIVDPRLQIVKDLQPILINLIQKGHKVIVNADINDEAGREYSHQWNKMMEETGMRNIIQNKHQNRALPRTYDKGKRCLDIIAVSENIQNNEITSCGILPFYSVSASDHRPLYVDFKASTLFDETTPDTTNQTYRRFTTKNTYKCGKYIQHLSQFFQEAQLEKKTKEIQKDIQQLLIDLKTTGNDIGTENESQKKEKEKIVTTLQKLDTKRLQLMLAAEKKCGIAPMKGMFWYSKDLRKAAQHLSHIKRKIRWLYKNGETTEIIQQAQEERAEALQTLRSVQKDSRRYRDEMLDDLAVKCSKKWKMTKESAVKVIKEAETHSNIFRKINVTVKEVEKTGVNSILVPTAINKNMTIDADKDDTNGNWSEIRNIDGVFETILEQNAKMLLKSTNGITARGIMKEKIGSAASNETFIEALLEGNLNAEELASHYPEYESEAKEMIIQMQQDVRSSPMEWKFGSEEYRQLFNHTREATSCGPSGLHMSHWKAATESDEITYVHATMIWAAFAMGITYDRWNLSFHSMLKKLQKPYVHKLRIIQLFEGDMNGGLKYLFGRIFMKKLVKDKVLDPNAYGSIPGRDPLEALKVLQYLYENHRIMKKDLVVVFNDAAGCYDRIRPNQAEICARRVGCATSLAKTHTSLQMNMTHHVKTSAGVSKGNIKFEDTNKNEIIIEKHDDYNERKGNIGGVGQGGGASPIDWLVILLTLLNAFKAFSDGARLIDPQGLFGGIIPVISFVDDNSITSSIPSEMSIEQIFEKTGKEMLHWKKLLNTTGGDLAVHKCTVTLMKWKWGGKSGRAALMTTEEAPGTVIIEDATNGYKQRVELKRLEVNESERQLGVIIPIDGTFTQEYKRRHQQSQHLGRQLYRSPLSHYESTLVYKLYYIPKMRYPLSITTFSQKQCNAIQSQFYRHCLPKMGINRHTPKALLFGPTSYGGFQLHDIYCDQIIQHIQRLQKHIRRQDVAGRAFMSNLNAYAILLGSATPTFQLSRTRYMYAGEYRTTVYFLWKMTTIWHLNLCYTGQHIIQQQYANEKVTIMDEAAYDSKIEWDNDKLSAINACRLYHGVVFLSDMLQYNRRYINKEYLFGRYSMRTKEKKMNWPTQPLPPDEQWVIWREFILRKYVINGSTEISTKRIPHQPLTLDRLNEEKLLKRLYEMTEKNQPNEYYIEKLPTKFQEFLQHWEATNSELETYWQSLSLNKTHIATDGSHIPETSLGAGAAVMAIEEDGEPKYIWVGSKCSDVEGMSSLTAEQYGIISALLLLHIICLRFGPPASCVIQVWIDNEEALRRITTGEEDDIRLKAYGAREYSDMVIMRMLLNCLPTNMKLNFHKIKSHQDQTGQELSFEAELNILADAKASHINLQVHGPVPSYTKTSIDGLIMTTNKGQPIYDIERHIRGKVKGESIEEYLRHKNKWTSQDIKTIDWKGMEDVITTLPMTKRLSYLQLIHNWQNTGAQKEKFARSAMKQQTYNNEKLQDLEDKQIKLLAQCPFQCGQCEHHMHFMECKAPSASTARNDLCKKFVTILEGRKVHDAIIRLLLWGVTWNKNKTTPTCCTISHDLDLLLDQAINEQTTIGWHNVRRGFISQKWAQAQRLVDTKTKSRTSMNWSKFFVQQILHISWQMWTHRNTSLHGTNQNEIRDKYLKTLQAQVTIHYERATELRQYNASEIDTVFKRKLQKRKQQGVVALETWLEMAKNVLEKAHTRASSKLEQWLQRKSTYIEKSNTVKDTT